MINRELESKIESTVRELDQLMVDYCVSKKCKQCPFYNKLDFCTRERYKRVSSELLEKLNKKGG